MINNTKIASLIDISCGAAYPFFECKMKVESPIPLNGCQNHCVRISCRQEQSFHLGIYKGVDLI